MIVGQLYVVPCDLCLWSLRMLCRYFSSVRNQWIPLWKQETSLGLYSSPFTLCASLTFLESKRSSSGVGKLTVSIWPLLIDCKKHLNVFRSLVVFFLCSHFSVLLESSEFPRRCWCLHYHLDSKTLTDWYRSFWRCRQRAIRIHIDRWGGQYATGMTISQSEHSYCRCHIITMLIIRLFRMFRKVPLIWMGHPNIRRSVISW